MDQQKTVLVTGGAGFIGMHTAKRFLSMGFRVVIIDNFNPYYEVTLKRDRILHLEEYAKEHGSLYVRKFSIEEGNNVLETIKHYNVEIVVHLAAQAGVQYSLINPYTYIDSNVIGFLQVIEACVECGIKHFVYASSSSVYGSEPHPFSDASGTGTHTETPLSLYAASKKMNELMAITYYKNFHLPSIGMRFFTVYGPWGRPDLSIFKFTDQLYSHEPIVLYNDGLNARDFTYIEDCVDAIIALALNDFTDRQLIVNIGSESPTYMTDILQKLEQYTGRKAAHIVRRPAESWDVPVTWADTSTLQKLIGFKPEPKIEQGLKTFVEWYQNYYLKGASND